MVAIRLPLVGSTAAMAHTCLSRGLVRERELDAESVFPGASLIVGVDHGVAHPVQLGTGQDGQQLLAKVQRPVDGAVPGGVLVDEIPLKGPAKLQILPVCVAQLVFTDDGGQTLASCTLA